MPPPIPEKLWKIDESTLGDHFYLDSTDQCFYVWEYAAHKGYEFSLVNNFVWNLKIKPSAIEQSPLRYGHKLEAIAHAAQALRALIPREFVEATATFVPIPCSKMIGHPEHDSRLLKVLNAAFHGCNADVRDLLKLTRSTLADHESVERLAFAELLSITIAAEPTEAPPRPIVVLFDDVLSTGKHFRVAQQRIRERYPDVEVRGLFLARCRRD